ncbi:MAG TPA: class I SAM-dependent methyltransferase [Anaeromyxobacter sp.]|nr:class I SAM-dependent methyltransferase [Anaeromyxobacter sp.]
MATHDNASAHAAADYDAQIEVSVPHHRLIHREVIRLVRAVDPAPGEWLDTGCGTGSLAAEAAAAFPRTRFLLADPSPGMLGEAGRKLEAARDRVAFLPPAGTGDLEPSAGPVDVLTAVQCHHYLGREARGAALERCRELLRPGGLLVVTENVRFASARAQELGRRRWIEYQIEAGRVAQAARAHVDRIDKEFFPITVDEHLALLGRLGFRDATLFWLSHMQAGVYALR